jgi:hypothetical protein
MKDELSTAHKAATGGRAELRYSCIRAFVIRASSLTRHSNFVIGHFPRPPP